VGVLVSARLATAAALLLVDQSGLRPSSIYTVADGPLPPSEVVLLSPIAHKTPRLESGSPRECRFLPILGM
jgi:hypothetical protein